MHYHLKKTKVRLELLTNIHMLLMVEKGIRGRMCDANNLYEQECCKSHL